MKNIIIFFITCSFFIACQKDEDVNTTATRLMFVHASPDAGALQLYVDSKVLLINPIQFFENTYYRDFIEGPRKLTVKDNGNTLLDTTITFTKNTRNSILLYDYATYLRAKILSDDVGGAPVNFCKLRVIQASPNLSPIKIVNVNTNATICTLNTLGDVSPFADVAANNYDFSIQDLNGNILFTNSTLTLDANKLYTLIIGGINGSSSMPLNMQLIDNNKF